MVYFPTGSEGGPERSQLMRTITANMAARSQVLSLIFGDFNFVEESRDRWNKDHTCWTGDNDEKDAKEFGSLLSRPPINCMKYTSPH